MKNSNVILVGLALVSLTSFAQASDKRPEASILSEIKDGSIYQSISSELYCADKLQVSKNTASLEFEILDSELSYLIPGSGGGYAYKNGFVFNDINHGKKVLRGSDDDMRAFGIIGKVTSETKADHEVITNVTVQNDKNTVFSMLVDQVPRRLLKSVKKTELRKEQDILNFRINIDHNKYGMQEQNCTYRLVD